MESESLLFNIIQQFLADDVRMCFIRARTEELCELHSISQKITTWFDEKILAIHVLAADGSAVLVARVSTFDEHYTLKKVDGVLTLVSASKTIK